MEHEQAQREWRMVAIFSPIALAAMKGNRGKLAAQAGHAYLHTFWDAEERFPERALAYRNSAHAVKIALLAPSDEWLNQWFTQQRQDWPMTQIIDAGFTCFEGPTLTCVGMGPLRKEEYPEDIKKLKLLL